MERAPMSALRERWGQLYGFCVLATSQCMADQPVAFRQLACTMLSGKGWATCQVSGTPYSGPRTLVRARGRARWQQTQPRAKPRMGLFTCRTMYNDVHTCGVC